MNTFFWIVLIVLLAATSAHVFLALRQTPTPQDNNSQRRELEEERDAALSGIRALEQDLANGAISSAAATQLRRNDERRAANALAQLARLQDSNVTPRPAPRWPLVLVACAVVAFGAFAAPVLQHNALSAQEQQDYANASTLENFEQQHKSLGGVPDQDLVQYAQAAWALKDYERAMIAYGELLKRNPRNAFALRQYGTASFFRGDNDQAEELLRLSLRLEPHKDAYLNLGNLLFSGRNDPAGALDAWQQYQKLGGDSARIPDLIAAAKNRLGAVDAGTRAFATNCAGCHGSNAQGIIGPRLAGNRNAKDTALVKDRIRNGKGNMPAFAQITGAELAALVKRVAAFGQGK